MCLTLCWRRAIVYDNDRTIVCSTCDFQNKKNLVDCLSCRHYHRDLKRELCLLTGMGIPSTKWCCHHNVTKELSQFKHSMKLTYGIVLVTKNQYEEAVRDYLENNPLLEEFASEDGVTGFDNSIELLDNEIPEQWFDNDHEIEQTDSFGIVDQQDIPYEETYDTANKFGSILEEILSDNTDTQDYHKKVGKEDRHKKIYVPVIVGEELIKAHNGVKGVVDWFEAIFGSAEDLLCDWKGRWIVKTERFAVPGIYGIPADKWEKYIDDDISDLLHDFFS